MSSSRLNLSGVTLCCVDTRAAAQAIHALKHSMRFIDFGDVLFLGDVGFSHQPDLQHTGIRFGAIPALRNIDDYSRFMLHELHAHVHTEHVLVIQWDGFISHPELWRDEYLTVDYIGAPWYHGGHPGLVGNGGFSLRSRKLLDASRHLPSPAGEPEDMTICVHQRHALETKHGIRLAPLPMAQAFACEYGPYRRSFGFHGMHNFAHAMEPAELRAWLDEAPAEIIAGQHARKLIKSLMAAGRAADALHLIHLRKKILGRHRDHYVLKARALASALRRRHPN